MIPLINIQRQFLALKEEFSLALEEVITSGQYILSHKVQELERTFATKINVNEAIGVANGTDALILALKALGVGPGDEVITTPFTFFATAESISQTGATPVFVDVTEDSFTICAEKIKEKITKRTKAIMPVHLFGQPADMDEINIIAKENNLFVIEDACQAFGAKYKGKQVGSLGDIACFSFFPTKNLGTIGDGGIVTTNNKELADKIRRLRVHGSNKKYFHKEVGYNSRLDEIHAAFLLVCLQYIDAWNEKRAMLADEYMNNLSNLPQIKLPKIKENRSHVFHLFCLRASKRQELMDYLSSQNIQTGVYYPCCLHLQVAYEHLGYKQGDFPVAEQLSNEMLAIPMFPYMKTEEQRVVINSLLKMEEDLHD